MQATVTTRRFDSRQIKQAALAVGLITSLAIGATTASIVRDISGTDSSTAALAGAPAARSEMTSYTFREQNLHLPTTGAVQAANTNSNYQFMEQNLYLQNDNVQPAAIGVDAMRFREMNLDLPGPIAAATPNWRVIEENSYGEDFIFAASGIDSLAPSPDDVSQLLTGEVIY